MDKALNTINLEVGYSGTVVKDLSIDIRPGEILALIGANGAGKSTVLKTITRQLNKLDGTIYINGKDEDKFKGEELSKILSMVTTQKVHPELMSAREVVATGRYPYTGMLGILSPDDYKKVDEAIKLVDGCEIMDEDFSKLSDGQKQRIMLARAICQQPEIMVLDEPTSFLDIQFKIDILSIIKRMALEKNIAVIMSIHDLEFVEAIADKVIAIDEKRAAAVGKPNEILTSDIIGKIYHMDSKKATELVRGLKEYSKALSNLI